MRSVKHLFLLCCRGLGLFWLARAWTRGRLLVLCYHGFSLEDEHEFRPKLFITGETFRRRLAWLRKRSYRVLPLEEALERVKAGTLPPRAVALTIDDGFHGVAAVAAPLLREFAVPATVYLTTYYCVRSQPIFRLLVQYLVWRAGREPDAEALGVSRGSADGSLRDGSRMPGSLGALIAHGEGLADEESRAELARALAVQLGGDADGVARDRILSLLDPGEVQALAAEGLDFQLHTHTHRFPPDDAIAATEIRENRAALEKLATPPFEHFCYPSGRWDARHFEVLEREGVRSATTCEPGWVTPDTHPYCIPRFLDGENISQLEFESELSGFSRLLRRVRGRR